MHSFLRDRDVTTVIWLWVIVDGVYMEISGEGNSQQSKWHEWWLTGSRNLRLQSIHYF